MTSLSVRNLPSLEEIHSSVPIPQRSWWRRFLAFSGPAFLVSVGYMDPGNWGSDIEAGSKFGYRLLWVLLMSNLMAVLLQSLATRLGVVRGRDLAQACRETYPKPTVFVLWVLCEIAIAATDLAEVIGTIIGLKLLFGLPYVWGLVVCACDTFLLLALQRRGIRLLELVTLGLVGVIAGSFVIEIFWSQPQWGDVVRGFVPGLAHDTRESLYVAIAMLGATVMPHNLYLHSALVQTRAFPQTPEGKRLACKYNFFDSMLALNGAFFVNAFILILSVSTFYVHASEIDALRDPQEASGAQVVGSGEEAPAAKGVTSLQDAHSLLKPLLGTALAGGLFAVALLASGQSSTLTGTLAGQVVMEGFVRLRLRPWARRLLTRSLAIVPAIFVIMLAEQGTGADSRIVDERLLQLLVLSQAILSFQLPFAIVPLVLLTSDRRGMGAFANGSLLKGLAWSCAAIVVGLNAVLIYLQMGRWASTVAEDGGQPLWVYVTLIPVAVALAALLGWVTVYPWLTRRDEARRPVASPELAGVHYSRIGVAVELEGTDDAVLAQAAALAHAHSAQLVAVHVVEGLAAAFHGPEADDQESRADRRRISELVDLLRDQGLDATGVLGFGRPPEELVRIATEHQFDLLVLGAHGHRFFADLALGQTVSPVLHRLTIPVLVVPNRPLSQASENEITK